MSRETLERIVPDFNNYLERLWLQRGESRQLSLENVARAVELWALELNRGIREPGAWERHLLMHQITARAMGGYAWAKEAKIAMVAVDLPWRGPDGKDWDTRIGLFGRVEGSESQWPFVILGWSELRSSLGLYGTSVGGRTIVVSKEGGVAGGVWQLLGEYVRRI